MAVYNYSRVMSFEALGGPVVNQPREHASPTREGRFLIGSIGKHKSTARWAMSTIEWGAPMRNEKGIMQVKQGGKWVNITSLPGFRQYQGQETLFAKWIQEKYSKYKASINKKISTAEANKSYPDTWIFNDFGHITIKYYRDTNNNFVRDRNEPLMSDFIHTIPNDEFYAAHGAFYPLVESHGCIHMHPQI